MTARPDIEGFLALAGKATPGPWVADNDDSPYFAVFEEETGGGICYLIEPDGGKILPEGDPDYVQHIANAALIAATKNTAPAIAEYALVLEEALRWIADVADKNYEQDEKLRSQGARTLARISDRARALIGDKP